MVALSDEAAPGRLLVLTTGPLPGSSRLTPDEAIDAQERRWSEETEIDWSWFERRGPLESRGDRRALVAHFLEPPVLEPAPGGARIRFALPKGSYATELLASVGVELPEDRSDRE